MALSAIGKPQEGDIAGVRRESAGRPPVTSRLALEQVALELFAVRGYEQTTVDDIAAAAGVSRRSFFRYYASKNDVVWGDFDAGLAEMQRWLGASDEALPMWESLKTAVVRFNELPLGAVAAHRQRMSMILHVPALQAHSTIRYSSWRDVVATFAAARLRLPVDSFAPQLAGHLALGSAVGAYEEWLRDPDSDLAALLNSAFSLLADVRLEVLADQLLLRH